MPESQKIFIWPEICVHSNVYSSGKYTIVQVSDIESLTPIDCLIFDVALDQLASLIRIERYTLVDSHYFVYACENSVAPFKVGLNFFPNLSLYKVILTGFRTDRATKQLYRSIAIGLGAEISFQLKTPAEFEKFADELERPSTRFLILVQQPYLLLALLNRLSAKAEEILVSRVFPPQLLLQLTDKLLSRQQVADIIQQSQLDTISNLKINTFKMPTMDMTCKFCKVDFVKDSPAKNIANLTSGKCFMQIISLDARFQKYMNLALSTHYIWGKLAICKVSGYIDANGGQHRYFTFTNEQLRAIKVNKLSLVLTYSKPIVIIVQKGFQIPFPTEIERADRILDSCTILTFDVLTRENFGILQLFKEKIIILTGKQGDIPEQFAVEFSIMSHLWFRCLQAEHFGAIIRQNKQISQSFPLDKAFSTQVIYTPNLLSFLSNTVLQALSIANFVNSREELPITSEDVLQQIFEEIQPNLKQVVLEQLQYQVLFSKKREQGINIPQLFQHLANGVPVQRAIENSRGFEQNYISGQMDSYYSGANISRIEDAKDDLMVDLEDEVFMVERSIK